MTTHPPSILASQSLRPGFNEQIVYSPIGRHPRFTWLIDINPAPFIVCVLLVNLWLPAILLVYFWQRDGGVGGNGWRMAGPVSFTAASYYCHCKQCMCRLHGVVTDSHSGGSKGGYDPPPLPRNKKSLYISSESVFDIQILLVCFPTPSRLLVEKINVWYLNLSFFAENFHWTPPPFFNSGSTSASWHSGSASSPSGCRHSQVSEVSDSRRSVTGNDPAVARRRPRRHQALQLAMNRAAEQN